MFMDHVHVHFGLATHILSDRGVPSLLGSPIKDWLTDLVTAGNWHSMATWSGQPDSMKVHDEFHISFLKLYHANGSVQPDLS